MALTNIQRILVRVPFALSSKRHIASIALQKSLGVVSKKPAPFPYLEKDYTLLTSMFDKTTSRFDENTKLIVLDGPIGVGKDTH
jgi:NADH dehydrogenase (ubiquinone) 1 alpha subcomplex subunit 10